MSRSVISLHSTSGTELSASCRRLPGLRDTGDDAQEAEFRHRTRPVGDPVSVLSSRSPPFDFVVALVVSPAGYNKILRSIRDAIQFLVANMGREDRMGLVTAGFQNGGGRLTKLRKKQ